MPDKDVDGCKVAILATDGVEQIELLEPRKALDAAGAQTVVVSPKEDGNIRGWNHTDWGVQIPVNVPLNRARSEEFDALLLPGGVQNPDKLRMNPDAVQFVREFFDAGKPVAAICHAAWTILEAGAADGRHLTSWPSLQTDLRNAGANWADEPVVRDRNLVTSRKPDDIPVFNAAMIELFREYMARTESEEQQPAA